MTGKLRIEVLEVAHDLLVTTRLAGLTLQRADLAFHFSNEVLDAQQILLGILELAHGLFFLRLKFGDAGGFFENQPAIFRFAGQDLGDVALRHDAVTGAANAGAHEQLLNVFEAARGFVDEVFGAAIAEYAPGQSHFIIGNLHTGGLKVFCVDAAEGQGHFGHAERLATVGAVKDDVGHFAAAQSFGRLFAEYPSNSVRDVALTAAIGAYDGGYTRLKVQGSLVREGLKP